MNAEVKNSIYDRLLTISLKIDLKTIPDPRYINEKIGQCHILIEEVEKFYIQVTKEISIVQRVLNNATVAYENSRDNLISTNEDIRSLPSQKDRESKANVALKSDLMDIRGYKNELVDLENLQKALNLKLKNLTRLNADIKTQLKLMDSQIRLGTPAQDSPAVRSLTEELFKSTVGADIFSGMESSSEDNKVIDPSEPLDVDSLLAQTTINFTANTQEVNNALIQSVDNFLNTPEQVGTEPASVSVLDTNESLMQGIDDFLNTPEPKELSPSLLDPQTEEEKSAWDRLWDPTPTDPEDDITSCMPTETGGNEPDLIGALVDLDKILLPELTKESIVEPKIENTPLTQTPGGIQKNVVETKKSEEPTQKEVQKTKNADEIDIASLLSQFN